LRGQADVRPAQGRVQGQGRQAVQELPCGQAEEVQGAHARRRGDDGKPPVRLQDSRGDPQARGSEASRRGVYRAGTGARVSARALAVASVWLAVATARASAATYGGALPGPADVDAGVDAGLGVEGALDAGTPQPLQALEEFKPLESAGTQS